MIEAREREKSGREMNCICIFVRNCILYICICINGKRDWEREERGKYIGRGRREANERGQRVRER